MSMLVPLLLGGGALLLFASKKKSSRVNPADPVLGVDERFSNFQPLTGNDGTIWFAQATTARPDLVTVFDPRTNKPVLSFDQSSGERVFVEALGEPGIVGKALASLEVTQEAD